MRDKRIEFIARQIRRDQVSFEVSELGWLRSNCLLRDTHLTTAVTLFRLSAAGSVGSGRKCGSGREVESGRKVSSAKVDALDAGCTRCGGTSIHISVIRFSRAHVFR